MMVDRFSRDEEAHDLRRSLEDQVDTRVAHRSLDRNRLLATRALRIGGLVAAPAANLERVVDDSPAVLRVVHLRDRGLESNVVAAFLDETDCEARDRVHC